MCVMKRISNVYEYLLKFMFQDISRRHSNCFCNLFSNDNQLFCGFVLIHFHAKEQANSNSQPQISFCDFSRSKHLINQTITQCNSRLFQRPQGQRHNFSLYPPQFRQSDSSTAHFRVQVSKLFIQFWLQILIVNIWEDRAHKRRVSKHTSFVPEL